jgi:hypothetical protein
MNSGKVPAKYQRKLLRGWADQYLQVLFERANLNETRGLLAGGRGFETQFVTEYTYNIS